MDRLAVPARLAVVTDLDQTMVDHHDPLNHSLLRFNALWESHFRPNSLLIFSTGRSPALYRQLRHHKPLLTPDVAMTSVGTEIAYGDRLLPDRGWEELLDRRWDRRVVLEETARFPHLSPQAETEQRPHKISFYVQKGHAEEVMESLYDRLGKRELDVKIIYSGGQALDVIPRGAGKGQALVYLLNKLKNEGKLPVNTLVCGDSGNDAELFSIPEVHGVMVRNAQEELLKWYEENVKDNPKIIYASERCAAGIIEAIGHFGLGPNTTPRDVIDPSMFKTEPFSPGLEIMKFYLLYERWLRAEVDQTKSPIQNLKQIVYPLGVAVHPTGAECSLEECLDKLEILHGDKQGKDFSVWIDKVSFAQLGSQSWLLRFNKWELTEGRRQGCVTTVLLNSKPESEIGIELLHVHQTWLDGYAASDHSSWIF